MPTSAKQHWETIYATRDEAGTSWFRPHLDESLRLIASLALPVDAAIIDVGGGRSTLVDDLLRQGFTDMTVLDIAEVALNDSRARLGERAGAVHWMAGNALAMPLPAAGFALWHDRAVYHFLTEAADRRRYLEQLTNALRPGGHAIIATFAADGPERCSGLIVRRYDADGLADEFASHFERVADSREIHPTPFGTEQAFTYTLLRRVR